MGWMIFFDIANNISSPDQFQESAEKYISATSDEKNLLKVADILGEHYRHQHNWEMAEGTYLKNL